MCVNSLEKSDIAKRNSLTNRLRLVGARRVVATAGCSSRHAIAAGSFCILFDVVVPDESCVAGLYDLVGGGELDVMVVACDPQHDALTVAKILPRVPGDGKNWLPSSGQTLPNMKLKLLRS